MRPLTLAVDFLHRTGEWLEELRSSRKLAKEWKKAKEAKEEKKAKVERKNREEDKFLLALTKLGIGKGL